MDLSALFMWLGFFLAAYSVVGNDVIQTLGTFLTSNEQKVRWQTLWLFAASILSLTLIYGYINADIDYGRLDKFVMPTHYEWYFVLPPLVLMVITRLGIPVSTTFMILSLFSLNEITGDLGDMIASVFDTEQKLGGMIHKSIMGYIIAFSSAILIYLGISSITEKKFLENPLDESKRHFWTVAQWITTAFLWSQWLTQDLANIYIYLRGGEELSVFGFVISLLIMVGLLAFIFYRRGGAVQNVVREKTNTADIRSATFVDLIYGIILYVFKYDYFGLWGGKLPMSTTWIFIGLLAGREIAIRARVHKKLNKVLFRMIAADLGKVFFGLVVSVVLVFIIKIISS